MLLNFYGILNNFYYETNVTIKITYCYLNSFKHNLSDYKWVVKDKVWMFSSWVESIVGIVKACKIFLYFLHMFIDLLGQGAS